MRIETQDLNIEQLDWAVWTIEFKDARKGDDDMLEAALNPNYSPSTIWSQGGPIIEREQISTVYRTGGYWLATVRARYPRKTIKAFGGTPLISAMRCFVASKLGDTVDIPEELCK